MNLYRIEFTKPEYSPGTDKLTHERATKYVVASSHSAAVKVGLPDYTEKFVHVECVQENIEIEATD